MVSFFKISIHIYAYIHLLLRCRSQKLDYKHTEATHGLRYKLGKEAGTLQPPYSTHVWVPREKSVIMKYAFNTAKIALNTGWA